MATAKDSLPTEPADDCRHDLAQLRMELAVSRRQICVEKRACGVLRRDNAALRCKLTEQESKFADVQHLAYFDQLTGLPNRSLLTDRFQVSLASVARSHRQLGLLFMDLNGFKRINDEHGHAVGDRILKRVAKRITCSLRAIDTACRYGGDEFVVLLNGVDSRTDAVHVAEKIKRNLAMPYHIDQHVHRVGVSVGVAIYPTDGEHFNALVKTADVAMYVAKACSRMDHAESVEVVTLGSL